MSVFSTDGLIIKTTDTGNSDRLCTVITRDNGIVRAFAKGAKNIKNKNHAGTNQLAYSDFQFYKGRDSYTINESTPKEMFFGVLSDLEKLALAQYFCELCVVLAPDGAGDEGFLRLLLNSLHLLSEDKYTKNHIKAVTELRMMCLGGYMPDLVMCSGCGTYESESMWLYNNRGNIRCGKCVTAQYGSKTPLSPGILTAMRHVCYSPFNKIYSFTLSPQNEIDLSLATEKFLCTQLSRGFNTLDFYRKVKTEG